MTTDVTTATIRELVVHLMATSTHTGPLAVAGGTVRGLFRGATPGGSTAISISWFRPPPCLRYGVGCERPATMRHTSIRGWTVVATTITACMRSSLGCW